MVMTSTIQRLFCASLSGMIIPYDLPSLWVWNHQVSKIGWWDNLPKTTRMDGTHHAFSLNISLKPILLDRRKTQWLPEWHLFNLYNWWKKTREPPLFLVRSSHFAAKYFRFCCAGTPASRERCHDGGGTGEAESFEGAVYIHPHMLYIYIYIYK